MRLKRVALGAGSVLLALIGLVGAAWTLGLLPQDSSEAASVQQALEEFRAEQAGQSPIEGVYLYATDGRESIDALGGASHTYPATTTITVTESGCGLELRWAALSGRSTSWRFCDTSSGLELRRSDERHSFFGRSDHTVYECQDRLLVPRRATDPIPFLCRSSRATERGESRLLGVSPLDVEGRRVEAVHVRMTLEVSGGDAGWETIDWWLQEESGIPLRVVLRSRTSRPLFVGRVHYSEDFDLRLISLQPRR